MVLVINWFHVLMCLRSEGFLSSSAHAVIMEFGYHIVNNN
jgi:hypothetical protein